METFETFTIDLSTFFKSILIRPLKLVAVFFLVVFIFLVIVKYFYPDENAKFLKYMPYFVLLVCKAAIYGYLFLLVFFYDFPTSKFVWTLPQQFSLNSAFVGALAAYEAITGLIGAFLPLFEKD